MRFEIVVAPPSSPPPAPPSTAPSGRAPSHPERGLRVVRDRDAGPAPDLLDVFVDGANVTARLRETHGVFVLRDLAQGLLSLARRSRGKATVRFYDEPWEMCVERFGASACVSVYRTGADPLVTLYDRAVPFDDVVSAVREAVGRVLASPDAAGAARSELSCAAGELNALGRVPPEDDLIPDSLPVFVEPERDVPLSFAAEFTMRAAGAHAGGEEPEAVERADLHALLFRGRVRAEVRGHVLDLGECHPFLVAERLLDVARRAFDAWGRGLALHTRGEVAGVVVGIRLAPAGDVALTLGAARGPSEPRSVHTFPALGAPDLLQAALSFGRSLVRGILRHDRAQSHNLRLGPFRRALREASDALREACQSDAKVNPTPEPYRAYAAALEEARAQAASAPPATRLRYAPRWRAIVPGIDLRGTYLCGDRLIVGSATEMWALDRATGRVLWRSDVIRGASVVTPRGVARLSPEGTLCVYDFTSGAPALRCAVAPRAGGPIAGAVVYLPGLPQLVIVTEGEHHLVAVDLATGEARWRWSWAGGRTSRSRLSGAPRMKRAGRLLYLTGGDGALTALDVTTGAVVWRVRDRLRFRTVPSVVGDALFAVAGGAHGVGRLYCVDPYTGRVRWSSAVGQPTSPCTIEGAPVVSARTVAITVRQKRGVELLSFERESGVRSGSAERTLAPSGTSWLAVDDAFVGNTPGGEIVSVDAATGELRWRQVLGAYPTEADVPRRLEPVLRCGALFVPHAEIVVLRPRDGAVLGALSPTEVIPDLLRVDERCDVYAAEESGHLVAFGALPRLTLVR